MYHREVKQMRITQGLIKLMIFSSCVGTIGCGSGSTGTFCLCLPPEPVVTVGIVDPPTSMAAGSTVTLTAAVTGSAANATWQIADSTWLEGSGTLGSLGTPVGDTVAYTAPTTAPIYDPTNLVANQGAVYVEAAVGISNTTAIIPIIATSITASISPTKATVALGSTLVVYGFAVGSLNTAVTMQVDGVAGGSMADGTIALNDALYYQYVYTAPATMPMSGSTVTITAVSVSDPTKTAALVVTLQ
jgi:hypothetical protein